MVGSSIDLAKSDSGDLIFDRFAAVRRHVRHGVVAPNKPLTLLWALDRIERGEPRLTPFATAEPELRWLLDSYGTPGTAASYAFWRLRNDGLWEVVTPAKLPARSGDKEPKVTALREHASGGFVEPVHRRLAGDENLRREAATLLSEGIGGAVAPVGRSPSRASARPARESVGRLVRWVAFRHGVMAAYGPRCVVCGWSLVHRGRIVGLEAAHVRPFGRGGPDAAGNGMPLCCQHHELFDAGLFTYDERRRLVPAGSLERGTNGDLRPLAGRAGSVLPDPLLPSWRVRDAHLAWHRRHVFAGA